MYEDDEALEALRMYVEDELNAIPPEHVDELFERFGGDPDTEYVLHRGLTLMSRLAHEEFLSSTKDGHLKVGTTPQSASTQKSIARQFAHCRKTNGNMAIAMMVSEQLKNGEVVAAHRGVLLSGKARGDQVIDLSKAGFLSEGEVLIMPNQSIKVEVETFVPLKEQVESAESDFDKLQLYRNTVDNALKNYIFLNYAHVLEPTDVIDIIEPAMEDYQASKKQRYQSILNSNAHLTREDGFIYTKEEIDPLTRSTRSGNKFFCYKVITENGNSFVIKENMATDRTLKRDRVLETVSVDAILPDGLVELYEKGGMLDLEQFEILQEEYRTIVGDLIDLVERFKIDTLDERLHQDLKLMNIPDDTEWLSLLLKKNTTNKNNQLNSLSWATTTGEMKKSDAKFSSLSKSLVTAIIKSQGTEETLSPSGRITVAPRTPKMQ